MFAEQSVARRAPFLESDRPAPPKNRTFPLSPPVLLGRMEVCALWRQKPVRVRAPPKASDAAGSEDIGISGPTEVPTGTSAATMGEPADR
jgi:hypothetical protein